MHASACQQHHARTMSKRCDASKIQVGDKLSRIAYYDVQSIDNDRITVCNENGFSFGLTKDIAENEMFSANQHTEEKTVTRTELAQVMENEVRDAVFTVTFDKQPKPEDAAETLKRAVQDDSDAVKEPKKRKKLAASLLHGEERVLVGHLVASEPLMGRSVAIDLDVPAKQHRRRLIDHRTLKSLVVRNTKFHVQ